MKKDPDMLVPEATVAVGLDADILAAITQDGIDLALWQRCLGPQLMLEVSALDLGVLDDLLLACDAGNVRGQLASLLRDSGYPDCPALLSDIAALAARHAALHGQDRVNIRLEVVETDACRKFHADFVTVRTITTYRGRGTQWKRNAEPAAETFEELPADAVALFKGRLLQSEPSILHRSPPIAGSCETRLVLVIDSIGSG